jgi:hypothetical protein
MRKAIDLLLVAGFLIVDWLIFHDFSKQGETCTLTEYLTGFLSVLVLAASVQSLLTGGSRPAPVSQAEAS